MELNFVQSSEVFGKNTLAWETEFEATGDFNLHVERNKGGDILVYQRTAGSGYAIVEEFRGMDNKPAIDLDFTSVVYPKFVKIVSESQPTYATITTDGEITEIKSQSKEVEVTANGTINVTPDAGFSYLNSVKVKTNVAQSGGGSGVPNYEIDGESRPLYYFLEGELAEKIFNSEPLTISEAESLYEKASNARIVLLKFAVSPMILSHDVVLVKRSSSNELLSFRFGGGSIDSKGSLHGDIIEFAKNDNMFEVKMTFYPTE